MAQRPRARATTLGLLGPAFVAAIAYVDPGNVAANLSGGAQYGYLLVWVLVAANVMAALIQYQSAKLGIVTGRSLPEVLGERLGTEARRAFWVQAEIIAAATDLAEVVGGAIALQLLFHLPLVIGGIVIGLVSMGLLLTQTRFGQRPFEFAIIALLAIIAIGFLAGLFVNGPTADGVLGGLLPRFTDTGSVVLAASILGATVMPHAIYVHSALARDRHGAIPDAPSRDAILRATRWDVIIALSIAGLINLGMLLLAATNLRGAGTNTIAEAFTAISHSLGPVIAIVFAVGLLASGLASTSVGSYAGAMVMSGLLRVRIPLLLRRVLTLIPALVVLALGVDPTLVLVISQVALSFGIPFALVPLVRLTGDRSLMGERASSAGMRAVLWVIAGLVVALNVALIVLALVPHA